jgi:MoxR-like ATPase
MEERQVTADGETRELPSPFFVIATQNPVEQEGTFSLPEAQVDRFAVKAAMGYPSYEGEAELLYRRANREERSPSVEPVLSTDQVRALQRVPETVRVDDDLVHYILEICRATREDPRVSIGVSPRGTQRLFETARARAIIEGRAYVTPDHVKTVAEPVLAHRLVLTADARVNGVRKSRVIEDVLGRVDVPTVD